MLVDVISDVHLEFNRFIDVDFFRNQQHSKVLVIAGDLCEARHLVDFPHVLRAMSENYFQVFYVLGNHEFYHSRYHKVRAETKQFFSERFPNIVLLDDSVEYVDGVAFIGSTLWSDLNKQCPITMLQSRQAMNDYHLITHNVGESYFKLRPEHTVEFHRAHKGFVFAQASLVPADQKVVVVTHHAPSSQSIARKFAGDYYANGNYYSSLEDDIINTPQIKYWIHGHTHTQFDYQIGHCQVVCNPYGYSQNEVVDRRIFTIIV